MVRNEDGVDGCASKERKKVEVLMLFDTIEQWVGRKRNGGNSFILALPVGSIHTARHHKSHSAITPPPTHHFTPPTQLQRSDAAAANDVTSHTISRRKYHVTLPPSVMSNVAAYCPVEALRKARIAVSVD